MLTHLGERSSAWMRVLRWAVLLLVVAAAVGGGLYVLRRGSGRTDLYQAAMEALNRGDRETAERNLRALLESGSQRGDVATHLMAILLAEQKYDEASEFAETWRGQERLSLIGWRAAIEIALRKLELVEAERLAREQAELDPEFAQFTILRVRDLMGTFADRWAAQRAAVAMATLTPSPEMRARTFLFAAETLRDLLAQADGGSVESAVRAAYRRAVNEARTSLHQIERAPAAGDPPRIQTLRARVALLSEDPKERRTAQVALEDSLRIDPDDHEVIASLAAYSANREIWDDALGRSRALAKGPPLLWIRAVQRLMLRERHADVLGLIRGGQLRDQPLVRLYEARTLVRGPETWDEGVSLLEGLVRDEAIHAAISLEAYRTLVEVGRSSGHVEALVERVTKTGDAVSQASLAEALATAGEDEIARALAGRIANHLESLPEGQQVLDLLGRGGEEVLDEFLRAPIEADRVAAGRRYFLRAATAAARAAPGSEAPRAQALRAAARQDLERLVDADVPKADLSQAWKIAVVLGDFELVGRLAGRAIGMSGPPHDTAFSLLAWSAATPEAEVRRRLADGLRASPATGSYSAFLETLARVVTECPNDPTCIRDAVDRFHLERGPSEPGLYLQAQVSWLTGDYQGGRRISKHLYAQAPDSTESRDLYGAFLTQAGEWKAVLDLHAGHEGDLSLASYSQLVAATMRLQEAGEIQDEERALNLARRAVRENPNVAQAHVLLAEVLSGRGDRRRALGILSIAPPGPAVNVMRARLLEEEGEAAVAEGLLRETITMNPYDVRPWRRMYLQLSNTGERGRLITLLSEALADEPASRDADLRAELLSMRALARLHRGEEDAALADFEAVIEHRPSDSVALNNAAWLICTYRKDRLAQALDYVLRALRHAPENADIHDTAAVIHLERGELDKALAAATKAVDQARADEKSRGAPPKPAYRVNRAIIRDRLGDRGLAIAELEEVAEEHPDDLAGIRAASILRQWAKDSG